MTLQQVLAEHWYSYARSHSFALCTAHHRAAEALLRCRTQDAGYRKHQCTQCGHSHCICHSCNHRSCAQCGGGKQKHWAEKQEAKLLPRVSYFMFTFTVPEQCRAWFYQRQEWSYDLLFVAVEISLNILGAKHQGGGQPAFISVLHTWTREMIYHPHIHVIMPGLALAEDGLRIHRPADRSYLIPCQQLATLFRNTLEKLILGMDTKLRTRGHSQLDPQVWAMDWVVNAQHVGKGQAAIRYLARYVAKSAVSDSRLLGYDEQGRIRLNCQDSKTDEWYEIALKPNEFVRRWTQHVLPKGLRRVRHYGWLAPAAKRRFERVCQILQHTAPAPAAKPSKAEVKCPKCKITMPVVEKVRRAWITRPQLEHEAKPRRQWTEQKGQTPEQARLEQAPPGGKEAG